MLRFVSVFVSVFFLSINFGAVLYVNSTLLAEFFSPEMVSALFVLGAVGNILLFLIAPKLIETVGKRFPSFSTQAYFSLSTSSSTSSSKKSLEIRGLVRSAGST